MSKINIAMNGFGRIGRNTFKAGFGDPKLNFVAINDLSTSENLAYLLKYDSVYGKYDKRVSSGRNYISVNNKKIKLFGEKEPGKLPWKKLKIDIVLECTGIFRTEKLVKPHLKAGAKKVIISAPSKGGKIKTIVYGVNENEYDLKKDHIISCASCTTNCLVPMIKVLKDNFGVKRGFMVTIHSYTAGQNLVDGSNKDLRRGRAAAANIVPTTSGAAIATCTVFPDLTGKLLSSAVRVSTLDGSLIELMVELEKQVTVKSINKAFQKASKGKLKRILRYTEEKLVSSDIIKNPASTIFDASLTEVIDGKLDLAKTTAWYDNEWGYSCRMIDLVKHVGSKI